MGAFIFSSFAVTGSVSFGFSAEGFFFSGSSCLGTSFCTFFSSSGFGGSAATLGLRVFSRSILPTSLISGFLISVLMSIPFLRTEISLIITSSSRSWSSPFPDSGTSSMETDSFFLCRSLRISFSDSFLTFRSLLYSFRSKR